MNDPIQLTDEQLRLATSRTLPAGAQLDAQTSAARGTFLSLGSALESAASNFDEAALISKLSNSHVVCGSPDPAYAQTCSRSRATSQAWPLLLCGALAASALFAIVRIVTMLPQTGPQIVIAPQPGRATAVEQLAPAPSRSTAGWNDPLDDEIALAAATIEQYGSRRRGFDGSIMEMNVQLEALSQELLLESL